MLFRSETEELERWTGNIEALGFQRLMDYQVKTDLNNNMKGFARLFVHPREHCFAEINQAFPKYGDPSAIGCTFISYLDDNWTFSNGNRKPSTGSYLIRRPRAMWVCMPDEPVEEIWAAHLKRRKKIANDLGVEALTDNTAKSHFEKEQQATLDRKKAVEGRSFVRILIDQWLFTKNPKYEWLGDYPRAAKKRK